ncbi:MAG: class I mannose-6-phosphate isomerase, partial [Clostridia bacterium]|nr:class I mannose-6-phosphate isomerase [Clostridia bacterium]
MTKKYPLLLTPAFKDYIWGGYNLKQNYYPTSPFDKTAEAWVLSAHKDGESAVTNGELVGKTLAEAIECFDKPLGVNSERFPFFPILIKMIDAEDNLSVQVHPDDKYALENEGGFGKTEMWYVVDHKPDACLYYGFKQDISREEFERRISDNTLTDVLNAVKVKKGDCFFIPAGTIHAIGKGMLIAEIQQSSNTTYRVYDYGRVG